MHPARQVHRESAGDPPPARFNATTANATETVTQFCNMLLDTVLRNHERFRRHNRY